jgi:predicted hydrolase (HD superfamily)
MEKHMPTRAEAFELLKQFNQNDSLIKHALAVEGAMCFFAKKFNEDSEKWGIIGLIHDLDYEKFPKEHCKKTEEILRELNWPEDYIRAVLSHGWGICTDVEPVSKMEKILYTIDELTGLIAATALVRPSKSILDMSTKSVKKKWKDKAFAAGVDRSIIQKGAEMLNMEIDELIGDTIMGMREVTAQIGLAGDNSHE